MPRLLPKRAGSPRSSRGPANPWPRGPAFRPGVRPASRPRRGDLRPRTIRWLEPAQLRLDRRGGRCLRSQLPIERDGADEDAQADIVERLAELGCHGGRQLLGAWHHAADRRPEIVVRVHGSSSRVGASVGSLRGSCNGRRSRSSLRAYVIFRPVAWLLQSRTRLLGEQTFRGRHRRSCAGDP